MNLTLIQGTRFVLVGAALLAIDSALYAGATLAGMPNEWANPLSRGLAAVVGYIAHLQLTFVGAANRRRGSAALLRYLLLWTALTIVSTQSLGTIAAASSAGVAVLAKPLVEAALAVTSFFLLKRWVYRT